MITNNISESEPCFKFHANASHSKKTFMRNITRFRLSNVKLSTFLLFRHIVSNKDFITGSVISITTKIR